jgi:hypothetical protein
MLSVFSPEELKAYAAAARIRFARIECSSSKLGEETMIYNKPEVIVLNRAVGLIQGHDKSAEVAQDAALPPTSITATKNAYEADE